MLSAFLHSVSSNSDMLYTSSLARPIRGNVHSVLLNPTIKDNTRCGESCMCRGKPALPFINN